MNQIAKACSSLLTSICLLALMAGSVAAQQAPELPPAQAKALQDWSYTLAIQAATWGSPIVIMYSLRNHGALGPNPKAAPNTIWRMENTSTPALAEKAGYVMLNLSVIYGFGFLDLRQEPVVLTLPDSNGLYSMVETLDMWTNAFAYPAGEEAGYKRGKVAFVGPGWQGELPPDLKRIDFTTPPQFRGGNNENHLPDPVSGPHVPGVFGLGRAGCCAVRAVRRQSELGERNGLFQVQDLRMGNFASEDP
jgi:hypothetical protein